MSDTPRTDEQINGKPCTRFMILAGDSLRDALVPAEFARELERENNELRTWKKEALAVESQLNAHYVANLLGAKLGESCHKVIAERVPALVAENKELRKVNEIGAQRLSFLLRDIALLRAEIERLEKELAQYRNNKSVQ